MYEKEQEEERSRMLEVLESGLEFPVMLRAFRKIRDRSFAHMSKILDIPAERLKNLESERVKGPTIDELEALASYYRVPLTRLYDIASKYSKKKKRMNANRLRHTD